MAHPNTIEKKLPLIKLPHSKSIESPGIKNSPIINVNFKDKISHYFDLKSNDSNPKVGIDSPLITAGVPILEIIRKLEEEKSLTKKDRILVNDILNDIDKQEYLINLFRDLELSIDKFKTIAKIKRFLKIYEKKEIFNLNIKKVTNASNTQENKKISNYEDKNTKDDMSTSSSILSDTKATICKVLTENPFYSMINNTNICAKIARRLYDYLSKNDSTWINNKKFCVIIGSGSFNPLTRMHLRTYFLAKQFIEGKTDMIVLGINNLFIIWGLKLFIKIIWIIKDLYFPHLMPVLLDKDIELVLQKLFHVRIGLLSLRFVFKILSGCLSTLGN